MRESVQLMRVRAFLSRCAGYPVTAEAAGSSPVVPAMSLNEIGDILEYSEESTSQSPSQFLSRRGFLCGLGLVAGAAAISQVVPLGRVWSFPSKIVVPPNHLIPLMFTYPVEYTKLAEMLSCAPPVIFGPPTHGDRTATGAELMFRQAVRIG